MNKEFTRMQKLAGILTEGYAAHSEVEEASSMHSEPKEGAMMGSHKGKMKVSEFKKKVKEAILAEKALKEDAGDLGGDNDATMAADADMDNMDEARYDSDGMTNAVSVINEYLRIAYDLGASGGEFNSDLGENLLADLHNFSDEISDPYLNEAKKKKEDEEAPEEGDVDIDLGTDGENIDLNLDGEGGMGDTQVDMNMDTAGDIDAGSSESKKAFSELTDAYRAAKELGDEKLIRQIANTITYFNKNIILSQG
jgi:hypothetical protein